MQTIGQSKVGCKPVLPLLVSTAFPPVLSVSVQSLYSIVDSMLMTQIGEGAFTAAPLASPTQALIVVCSVGIGVRVNSYIARELGEQNQKKANSTVARGLLLSLTGYLLFIAIGSSTIRPSFEMFTDSATILDDVYMYTYVCVFLYFGCFFYILIEKVFQSVGKMTFSVAIQAAGAITNITLDPIMIFGLLGFPAVGVKGAVITTVIGQIFAMSLSLFVSLTRRLDVKLDLKQFYLSWDTIYHTLLVGIPNACMNALGGILVIGLNSILIRFSDMAVSVYGIYYKLQAFVSILASSPTQGMIPIMGYNYGVGDHERLLQTLKYVIMVMLAIMVCDCATFPPFPTQLLVLFHAGEDMLRISAPTLRIISVSFLPTALGFILPTLFQAVELGLQSLIVFLFRQLCIALPLSRLFTAWFSLDDIWYSFLIAKSIAAGVVVLLFIRVRKKDKALSSTFVQQLSVSQETVCWNGHRGS